MNLLLFSCDCEFDCNCINENNAGGALSAELKVARGSTGAVCRELFLITNSCNISCFVIIINMGDMAAICGDANG